MGRVLHKAKSQYLQGCDDYDVWTLCGLGDGGKDVEFDIAIGEQVVTCKTCLKSLSGDSGKKRAERKMRKEASALLRYFADTPAPPQACT